MRGVFSRGRRAAAVCLLMVVLLAPTAFASGGSGDASLWDEFIAWMVGESGTSAGANQDSFSVWLMGRIGIPGG